MERFIAICDDHDWYTAGRLDEINRDILEHMSDRSTHIEDYEIYRLGEPVKVSLKIEIKG